MKRHSRMAKLRIRYFTERRGSDGPRYFWQPSKELRDAGWALERLPDDRAQAILRAEELNRDLDAWRQGTPITANGKRLPDRLAPGTVAALIAAYKRSRYFREIAPKTQRSYEQNLRVIEDWLGPSPLKGLQRRHCEAIYDYLRHDQKARGDRQARQGTPAKARAVMVMLQIVLNYAVAEKALTENPALKMKLRTARAQSGLLWPRAALAAMIEEADQAGYHSLGTALCLMHWLGQREGDIIAMQRASWRDGHWSLVQSKTATLVNNLPESPTVAARVAAELERQAERNRARVARKLAAIESGDLLLCETTNQRWKEDHFRHVFSDIRARVAARAPVFHLPDGSPVETARLQVMHLRHTAITELAAAGATDRQIAAVSGHSAKTVTEMLNRYALVTGALAAEAMKLRAAAEREQGK